MVSWSVTAGHEFSSRGSLTSLGICRESVRIKIERAAFSFLFSVAAQLARSLDSHFLAYGTLLNPTVGHLLKEERKAIWWPTRIQEDVPLARSRHIKKNYKADPHFILYFIYIIWGICLITFSLFFLYYYFLLLLIWRLIENNNYERKKEKVIVILLEDVLILWSLIFFFFYFILR